MNFFRDIARIIGVSLSLVRLSTVDTVMLPIPLSEAGRWTGREDRLDTTHEERIAKICARSAKIYSSVIPV